MPGAIAENDLGGARCSPRARCGIDQLAQRIVAGLAEPQEQAGRQSWRPPAVGLRLVAISQNRVEDMRPEAGFCSVTAASVAIAEQRVQPSIRTTPSRKIIDQLDMAITVAQSLDPGH